MRVSSLPLLMVAQLSLVLAACADQPEGESADDFASRVGGAPGQTVAAPSVANAEPAFPDLPKPAANGAQAISRNAQGYTQTAADGSKSGLSFGAGNTFNLTENGRTVSGKYEWLADGKRLRLIGVGYRPIVLVADGAIYRLTNEDVPIDDLTPDRMYQMGDGGMAAAK